MDPPQAPYPVHLTPPGEIRHLDFRPTPPAGAAAGAGGGGGTAPPSRPLRLLTWNIERGYRLAGVIEELRRADADILALQEVDVGCDRSGGVDTGAEIARALGLNMLFFCEFEELRSPARDARTQGGGVHGNAILSKFDLSDAAVVRHRHTPVDWNSPATPYARREPRRGERGVLRATVAAPAGALVVYSAHFEVFCGLLSRVAHLADVFEDVRAGIDAGALRAAALLGDLNSMAHGVARLSPAFGSARMRARTVGADEAVVWERHVLAHADALYSPAADDARGANAAALAAARRRRRAALARCEAGGAGGALWRGGSAAAAGRQLAEAEAEAEAAEAAEAAAGAAAGAGGAPPEPPAAAAAGGAPAPPASPMLLRWGAARAVAARALNPGFACPFPAAATATLDNPRYRFFGVSLMCGKLDWCLLRRCRVVGTRAGNARYALSDHKWLGVDVELE